jgi:hypothetical protein
MKIRLIILVVSLLTSGMVYAANDPMVSLFKFQSQMAQQGNVDAIMKLGEMYEQGQGTKQNFDKALEMYKKAEQAGNTKAAKAITRIGNKKKQIAKAKREKAAKEKAARERVAREKAAREQAIKDQAAREQATREQAEKEKAARERAQREKLRQEKLTREKMARERLEREQAARLQAAKNKAARERAAREKAVRDKAAQEQLAREKTRRKQQEQEKTAAQSNKDKDGFSSNPCNTPAARLMSTCK